MKTTDERLDDFIDMLRDAPEGCVFNPWWQNDPVNDDYSNAYEIRQYQLKAYLGHRLGKVDYLLCGEALGYQGGHFTGIAMTSERMLLGHLSCKGITPQCVFTSLGPTRTSKESVKEKGFNEPTATVVWQHMLAQGVSPYNFVIWNAFPWHPYKKSGQLLSNRTPTGAELNAGLKVLKKFIEMTSPKIIVAVGEKASSSLKLAEIKHQKVRHPANGGTNLFRAQMSEIIAQSHFKS